MLKTLYRFHCKGVRVGNLYSKLKTIRKDLSQGLCDSLKGCKNVIAFEKVTLRASIVLVPENTS